MPVPIPVGGMGGGGGGAGAAGAMAGADILSGTDDSDDGLGDVGTEAQNEAVPDQDYPSDDFTAPDDPNTEWGSFEEPDYGFQEDPSDDDWGGGAGDDSEGGSSILDVLSGIFGDGGD